MATSEDGSVTPPAASLFSHLADGQSVSVERAPTRQADYLNVPVLVIEEGDGWVLVLWPDKERPGRSHGQPKPYTYRKGEWWRVWSAQTIPCDHPYESPPLPLVLEPKPSWDPFDV